MEGLPNISPLNLLISGLDYDFKIVCGEYQYHIHIPIICSKSDFFKLMLKCQRQVRFKSVSTVFQGANDEEESITRTVTFPEDDRWIIFQLATEMLISHTVLTWKTVSIRQ